VQRPYGKHECGNQAHEHLYSKTQPFLLSWLQGSFQVCLNAGQASEQGAHFLADGCRPLKAAFANDNLMLRPAAAGVPPGGQTILWYVSASAARSGKKHSASCCAVLGQHAAPADHRHVSPRQETGKRVSVSPSRQCTLSRIQQAPSAAGMIQKQQS